jgi:hypothetical protein
VHPQRLPQGAQWGVNRGYYSTHPKEKKEYPAVKIPSGPEIASVRVPFHSVYPFRDRKKHAADRFSLFSLIHPQSTSSSISADFRRSISTFSPKQSLLKTICPTIYPCAIIPTAVRTLLFPKNNLSGKLLLPAAAAFRQPSDADPASVLNLREEKTSASAVNRQSV